MNKKARIAKILRGTVVSDRMQKTVVVRVERYKKVPRYRKYLTISKRFKAHDEKGEYNVGDNVLIQETRPLSKEKRWRVVGKIGGASLPSREEAPNSNILPT